jgi:hypothetical protein
MSHTVRLAAVALALAACATPGVGAAHPARSGPYTLELIDEAGRVLPTFHHRGRTYVLGTQGARYMLRIRNQTGGRIEVVASVDGRDVVDGKAAAVAKPGYLVDPWGQVVIDGFRLSTESVAAFRFSTVDQSYAARMGDARDVGVIGVAVFTEARPAPVARPWPRPYPEPYLGGDDEEATASRDGADGAGASEAAPAPPRAAPSTSQPSADLAEGKGRAEKSSRPGLGTGFGEAHDSRVVEVAFERASSTPAALVTLRYDDRRGLVALGIDVDGGRTAARDRQLRNQAQPFRQDGFSEPPPGWSGR